jgi:prevent-host-death family protein
MKAVTIMEKTIGAFEVRRQFGKMLTGILAGGDRYIIERHGEPVAVLVPLELYQQWQRGRDRFFDHIEAVAKRADMATDEADDLVREAIREVRGHGKA